MSDTELDTSPDSEGDTASGGAAEPRDVEGTSQDTATGAAAPTATNPPDAPPATTEQDGTPVENPSG